MKKYQPAILWFIIAAVWIALDQITKHFAMMYLQPIGSKSIIGDLLRFTYAENRGMAFSISIFPPWFLSVVKIVAAVVISIIILRDPKATFRNFCFSLILAGAVGNVIDRLHYGFVVDFIDVDFPDFIMQRWPIFNLADSGISVGVTLFAIYHIFIEPKLVPLPPKNTTSLAGSNEKN